VKDWLWTSRWYARKIKQAETVEEAKALGEELERYCTIQLGEKPEIPNEDRPSKPELPEGEGEIDDENLDGVFVDPIFSDGKPNLTRTNINVSPRGTYFSKGGNPLGWVVHFTAGRFSKGKDSALGTLRWLGKSGLGCLVMDTDGNIYQAKNQDLNERDSHAGVSKWQGKSSVSNYCGGMEICNAGKLRRYKGQWHPWWNFDNKGRYKGGSPIPDDQVRIGSKNKNAVAGAFHKYTPEQEASLIEFLVWQAKTNPDFQVDWICGHDECAGDMSWAKGKYGDSGLGRYRKTDPGHSLSMTMDELRDLVKRKAGE
jgi:N-acetyl-anhydromuramyl-L-alanine amidase AmpD